MQCVGLRLWRTCHGRSSPASSYSIVHDAGLVLKEPFAQPGVMGIILFLVQCSGPFEVLIDFILHLHEHAEVLSFFRTICKWIILQKESLKRPLMVVFYHFYTFYSVFIMNLLAVLSVLCLTIGEAGLEDIWMQKLFSFQSPVTRTVGLMLRCRFCWITHRSSGRRKTRCFLNTWEQDGHKQAMATADGRFI